LKSCTVGMILGVLLFGGWTLSATEPMQVLFIVPTKWVVARQFFPIVDLLEENEVHVDIVSSVPHEHLFWEDFEAGVRDVSSNTVCKYQMTVTLAYDDVDVDSYAAVLVPGGHSQQAIIASEKARNLLVAAADAGKIIGGVGQGVPVLLDFDFVVGREVTLAPGEESDVWTPSL